MNMSFLLSWSLVILLLLLNINVNLSNPIEGLKDGKTEGKASYPMILQRTVRDLEENDEMTYTLPPRPLKVLKPAEPRAKPNLASELKPKPPAKPKKTVITTKSGCSGKQAANKKKNPTEREQIGVRLLFVQTRLGKNRAKLLKYIARHKEDSGGIEPKNAPEVIPPSQSACILHCIQQRLNCYHCQSVDKTSGDKAADLKFLQRNEEDDDGYDFDINDELPNLVKNGHRSWAKTTGVNRLSDFSISQVQNADGVSYHLDNDSSWSQAQAYKNYNEHSLPKEGSKLSYNNYQYSPLDFQ